MNQRLGRKGDLFLDLQLRPFSGLYVKAAAGRDEILRSPGCFGGGNEVSSTMVAGTEELATFGALAKLILVVPNFNEEDRLPVKAFLEYAKQRRGCVRFLLVNDGSTDGTLGVLRSLEREAPDSFSVLDLGLNRGKAEAVRLGMLEALDAVERWSSGEAAGKAEAETEGGSTAGSTFIGFWDGDLATPLASVDTFMHVFVGRPSTEMVFGSRVALLGRRIERRMTRHYLGRVFATFASMLLRLGIYDTQCGAKIFRATEDIRMALSAPFDSRWIFDVELIARLQVQRERALASTGTSKSNGSTVKLLPLRETIFEAPLMQWRDIGGSKLGLKHKLRAAYGLFQIWKLYSPSSPWGDGWNPERVEGPTTGACASDE